MALDQESRPVRSVDFRSKVCPVYRGRLEWTKCLVYRTLDKLWAMFAYQSCPVLAEQPIGSLWIWVWLSM